MIIQIRGTSGSGKSWVVHNLIKTLEKTLQPWGYFEETASGRERKIPSWYTYGDKIKILGPYQEACGGVDNIGASAPRVFPYMEQFDNKGNLVFAEGLLLSEDVIWSERLKDRILVLHLDTPVDKCFQQVMSRKAKTGRGSKDLDRVKMKLAKRVQTISRAVKRMETLDNCQVVTCNSKRALRICKRWVNEYI